MSAAMLETNGPALIAHCVGQWLVENQVSAEIIAQLSDDTHAIREENGGEHVSLIISLIFPPWTLTVDSCCNYVLFFFSIYFPLLC